MISQAKRWFVALMKPDNGKQLLNLPERRLKEQDVSLMENKIREILVGGGMPNAKFTVYQVEHGIAVYLHAGDYSSARQSKKVGENIRKEVASNLGIAINYMSWQITSWATGEAKEIIQTWNTSSRDVSHVSKAADKKDVQKIELAANPAHTLASMEVKEESFSIMGQIEVDETV